MEEVRKGHVQEMANRRKLTRKRLRRRREKLPYVASEQTKIVGSSEERAV